MTNIDMTDKILLRLKIDQIIRFYSFVGRNIQTTSNWLDLVQLRLGIKKNVRAIFRDGVVLSNVNMENYSEYRNAQEERIIKSRRTAEGVVFFYNGKEVRLRGEEAPLMASDIFISEEYGDIKPSGKIIVDIGANIGDTAIYFSLNGAAHVYAFEPYPYVYRLAKENIESNGLADKVTMIKCAIDAEKGEVRLDPNSQSFGGSDIQEMEQGIKIPVITLKDIVKTYNIKDAILKMDIEGGEYRIISTSDTETLRAFTEIIMEYHYGYSNLKKWLENAGFRVKKVGMPYAVFNSKAKNPRMVVGLIHAIKISES